MIDGRRKFLKITAISGVTGLAGCLGQNSDQGDDEKEDNEDNGDDASSESTDEDTADEDTADEDTTDEDTTNEEPVLKDISLETADVSSGTELQLTVLAESNITVNWLHISLEGPNGNIRGGGQAWEFTEVEEDLWETEWAYTVSDEAASGEYSFSRIHVENEADLQSDPWPGEPSTTIDNS